VMTFETTFETNAGLHVCYLLLLYPYYAYIPNTLVRLFACCACSSRIQIY